MNIFETPNMVDDEGQKKCQTLSLLKKKKDSQISEIRNESAEVVNRL